MPRSVPRGHARREDRADGARRATASPSARPSTIGTWPIPLRLLARLQTLAHEGLALVAVKILGRGVLVARLHLLGLGRVVISARRRVRMNVLRSFLVRSRVPSVTLGQEVPALLTGEVLLAGLGAALRHVRGGHGVGRLLVGGGGGDDEQHRGESSEYRAHGILLVG